MSAPLTVDLTIEALGAQGDGIGHHAGAAVFVPYALPGEYLRVLLYEKGKNVFMGRVIEILRPASDRVVPPCPVFGQCGGCALQHLSLSQYQGWKREQVATTLATRGITLPAKTHMISTASGERRRAVFAAAKNNDHVTLGFHAVLSHDIVPLEDCLLLTSALRESLPSLHSLAEAALYNKQKADLLVTETLSGLDVLIQSAENLPEMRRQSLITVARNADIARLSWQHGKHQAEPLMMQRVPQIRFGDVVVDLPIGAFLQPSLSGEAALVNAVLAGIGKAKRIADLYGGCGTFGFPLAKYARVLCVDRAKPAIAALIAAVNRVQLSGRIEGMVRDLDQSPLPPQDLKPFDAVVFDPPRAGAEMQARMIGKSVVKRVVAVSCHPASFARDARILLDAGFNISRLTILDQFLWSHHAELVAVFERNK